MMKGKLFITAVLTAALILEGCLFQPREAERPGGEEENTWIIPRVPKDVFRNMISGLKASANSNYERSLGDNFTFVPLSQDVSAFPPGSFDNWTDEVELEVLNRIKGDYQGARTVQFGDENLVFEKENELVGEAIFEGSYTITLYGSGSTPDIYQGKAEFRIKQTSAGWVLEVWKDIDVIGSNPTSGNLRGSFRSGG